MVWTLMEKTNSDYKVCVTGGAGYVGSWLTKILLERGYTVHVTLRNLEDSSKVSILQSLPNAETNLKWFKADIYNPDDFEQAIQGCGCVFHVATPLQHNSQSSQFKDISEAAVAGVESIVKFCIRSKTVKKLIYTASVVAASPMKEDGSGFKDSVDEDCWTPLGLSLAHSNDMLSVYTSSKTLAEKVALSYNDKVNGEGLKVVSLVCTGIGGDTLLPYLTGSQEFILAQLTQKKEASTILKFLHELLGSLPLVHILDVCEAHVFCMEKPLMVGRFLCSNGCLSLRQLADYWRENYPEFKLIESFEEQGGQVNWDPKKLVQEGFQYNYDFKKVLDDTLNCGRRLGAIN
ncbi:hypothetical protein Sjap_005286 [Stephania japonica]|uniref:NAD-dependent epimerase/dehydratase domain-containing protein n=1 Tax=Stephania japonica TaxID=461633 RepID=A0AAP0K5A9_9MAGN